MTQHYDVIIIGAGILGTSTAFELSKAGYRTLNIDALPEAGYGSTSHSSAIIRTHYSAFETCALASEGWHYWNGWEDHLGVTDNHGMITFHNVGCMVMKTPTNNFLKVPCAALDAVGFPYVHLRADEIATHMPGADLANYHPAKRLDDDGFAEPTGGSVAGAVFFPRAGYVNDPKLAAHNMQRAAEAHGAAFKFNTKVAAIRQSSGRVAGVALGDGSVIDAPVVINIAGPYSSQINAMAGVADSMRMRTRALREEVAHVRAPDSFKQRAACVTSDSDVHIYTRPAAGNHLVVGSEGPPCDGKAWVDDPDDYDTNLTDLSKLLVMRLGQRLPHLGIPDSPAGVVALYDVSDDFIPIYDCSDLPGFYMACGTSGNQFKNAPVVGKIMTALITACEGGHDHDADPVVFPLTHLGTEISLGFFSRNRDVNQTSSFSVIG